MNNKIKLIYSFFISLSILFYTQLSFAGAQPGINAKYWTYSSSPPSTTLPVTTPILSEIESNINFSNSTSFANGAPSTQFIASWTGLLLIPTTGFYTFSVNTDDGVRLYIDCNNDGTFSSTELLINQWNDQSPTNYSAGCSNKLNAGTYYSIRYDYYNNTGPGTAQLMWSGPVGGTKIIPIGDGTQGLYANNDNTPVTITSAATNCGLNALITVNFNKIVTTTSAQNIGNYSISGYSINSAVLNSSGNSVNLTLNKPLVGNANLIVNNISDTTLPANTIAANTSINLSSNNSILSNGIKGTYYDQNNTAGSYFTGTSYVRIDSNINFDWGTGNPGITGIGVDHFSVRWTGLILVPTTGNYIFRTISDDGVKLYINNNLIINDWTDHGATTDNSSSITLQANTYYPITMEFYENGGSATAQLQWITPTNPTAVAIPSSQFFTCTLANLNSFSINVGGSNASTCSPKTISITAQNSAGTTINNYTGTINLSTSVNKGNWGIGNPSPNGTLTSNVVNDGTASYTFTSSDSGIINLTLSDSLAQNLNINVVDTLNNATLSSSSQIQFRDNAFIFAEDLSNKISGSNIAVAGRPHDFSISLVKKDLTTGICGVATDFSGSRNLKIYRTDSNGTWNTPIITSPITTIPTTQPNSNNLNLTFNSGVANFNLLTNDIAKYNLNLIDDSLSYAANPIYGSSSILTVRPFAIVVSNIKQGSVNNPNGSLDTDPIFTTAGNNFQATVGAYLWNSAADSLNIGTPNNGVNLSTVTAGGLIPSFNSTVLLTPIIGSQTPATGILGALNNNSFNIWNNGVSTNNTLNYTEVGSFLLNQSSVVTNFLSTSGLNLDILTFNSSGIQNQRVGRFIPAKFTISANSLTNRSSYSCIPASNFTYMNEPFQVTVQLAAKNLLGNTTVNYSGNQMNPNLSTSWNFGAVNTNNLTSRLTFIGQTGTWNNGILNSSINLQFNRLTNPDGAFNSVNIGIAPTDTDNVNLTPTSYNLDTNLDSINDSFLIGNSNFYFGRLKIMNAVGSEILPLPTGIVAQYFNGFGFLTNTQDSCTTLNSNRFSNNTFTQNISSNEVSFIYPTKLISGAQTLTMNKPSGGDGIYDGTFNITYDLLSDNKSYLLGKWTGSVLTYTENPIGKFILAKNKGKKGILYMRENY